MQVFSTQVNLILYDFLYITKNMLLSYVYYIYLKTDMCCYFPGTAVTKFMFRGGSASSILDSEGNFRPVNGTYIIV